MKKFALTLTILFGFVGTTSATMKGDAEAGKTKSITCTACHGTDGNKTLDGSYPKLAGQNAEYLVKQLIEFKKASETAGKEGRNNVVMNGQAAMLSEQDMHDISAYFASLNMSAGATPEDVIAQGKLLYTAGDASRAIPACTACHGPRGEGLGLAGFPRIAYQNETYIQNQLKQFRDGTRANDMNKMMRDIASKLTDADIEILSKYMQGLH